MTKKEIIELGISEEFVENAVGNALTKQNCL